MFINMRKSFFLALWYVLVTCPFSHIEAQTASDGLVVIARNTADSVVLRWAPRKPILWSRANRYGYQVERLVVDKNSKSKVKAELLSGDTLRPWSIEAWKKGFPQSHPYAPVALQAVHGKSFSASNYSSASASIRAQSQEQDLRFSFAVMMADFDGRVADALALRWCDKSAPKDRNILYRVISLDPEYRDTAIVAVDRTSPDAPIPQPDAPQAEGLDLSIKLRWNTYPEAPVFTAYWLERSDDKVNWQKTSAVPLIKADAPTAQFPEPYLYFTDTMIARNYVPVYYRVRGITAFAEVSAASEIIAAMGRDKDAPPSPVMRNPMDSNGTIEILWDYPDAPKDLQGFMIGRAAELNGSYVMLTKEPLPTTARSYIDNSPDAMGENYYVVYARDTAGNISASMPAYGFLRDSLAPGKPSTPAGTIDTNGIVRLHWPLGPEPDIIGYRVYFANALDHEFSVLTPKPSQDTNYVDTITLNTLSKKIYYKIVAVDRNYNHSNPSEVLVLSKPDILPPVSPLLSDFTLADSGVVLTAIPSSSKDVVEHILYRREAENGPWIAIDSWKGMRPSYRLFDRNIKGATYYQYALQAIDSSGNRSELSPTIDVRTVPKISHESLQNLKSNYQVESKKIQLRWNAPLSPVKYYVIYRGKDGKRPVSLTSVDGMLPVFYDSSLVGKGSYRYMIKAIYKDGGESPITAFEEVVVN